MRELVAVEITGERFVDVMTRAWSSGDAIVPIDPRLPRPARLALLDALRPGWVLDAGGTRHRRADGRAVQAGDALVMVTSGTTGPPRAVLLTHDAVAASARASSARLGVDPAADVWLACLPLAHVGGLSVITRALITGTPVVVLDRFEAPAVTAAAESGRAGGRRVLISLVATALSRLEPEGFGVILLGGAAPPPSIPPNAVVTYGMTETGSGVLYDGVPLRGVEVNVDERGEIRLRGPMLGRAYRSADGETPLTDGDGWLATGDGGHFDPAGRLVVEGRLADVIVTGGEKVWPGAVEAVVRTHPGVADVAVTGAPDPQWGQRVVAVVVPAGGGQAPSLAELRDLVKQTLPPWAAPRQLVLSAALPATALGKVRRRALARLVEQAESGA